MFYIINYLNLLNGVKLSTLIRWWHSGKKKSACQPRKHRFDPWVGKMPWRRAWQPTPEFLPENPTHRRAWWATVHGIAEGSHAT